MKLKTAREIDIYAMGFQDGLKWFRENADLKRILDSENSNKE